MKTRERLARMRSSKSFAERLMLAADRYPRSRFERLILLAHMYPFNEGGEEQRELNNEFRDFQKMILAALCKRNSKPFRELAEAIDAHRDHKRNPDKMRQVVLCYAAARGNVVSVRGVLERLRQSTIPVWGGQWTFLHETTLLRSMRQLSSNA